MKSEREELARDLGSDRGQRRWRLNELRGCGAGAEGAAQKRGAGSGLGRGRQRRGREIELGSIKGAKVREVGEEERDERDRIGDGEGNGYGIRGDIGLREMQGPGELG